jgi:hypothetical protein
MPTQTIFVPPALFMTHATVAVYHAYKDDDFNEGPSRFRFTLDASSDDKAFDVRNLEVPSRPGLDAHPPLLSEENQAIANATPQQLELWKEQWRMWEADGLNDAIRTVLREAIDMGRLPPA